MMVRRHDMNCPRSYSEFTICECKPKATRPKKHDATTHRSGQDCIEECFV